MPFAFGLISVALLVCWNNPQYTPLMSDTIAQKISRKNAWCAFTVWGAISIATVAKEKREELRQSLGGWECVYMCVSEEVWLR